MGKLVAQDLDFNSVARILNLPAATASGHPVTFDQLTSAIEGIAWKDSVVVSTQANLNLASPGATIDGITMVAGDRVLVRAQTSVLENGIYIWNGAAVAMTRAADATTFAELEGAALTVEEGTNAGVTYRQTQVNGVIETNDVIWTTFGSSAPAASETTAGIAELATQAETDTGTDDARIVTPLKLKSWSLRVKGLAQNVGDGAATQIDVTHNFNTRDVRVEVYRNGTPWDSIICDVERSDVNTVRLRFASAPTSNQFRVIISTVPSA